MSGDRRFSASSSSESGASDGSDTRCLRCRSAFGSSEKLQQHIVVARHYACAHPSCARPFDNVLDLTQHRAECPHQETARIDATVDDDSTNAITLQAAAVAEWEDPTGDTAADDLASRRAAQIERLRQRAGDDQGVVANASRRRFVFLDLDGILTGWGGNVAQATHSTTPDLTRLTARLCQSRHLAQGAKVWTLRATYFAAPDEHAASLVRAGWRVEKRQPQQDPARILAHLRVAVQDRRVPPQDRRQNSADVGNSLVLALGLSDVATGDATVEAYVTAIEHFVREGWCVEVHGWSHTLDARFVGLMAAHPAQVAVCLLENNGDHDQDDAGGTSIEHHQREVARLEDELLRLTGELAELETARKRLLEAQGEDEVAAAQARTAATRERLELLRDPLDGRLLANPVLLACCLTTISARGLHSGDDRCPCCHAATGEGFVAHENKAVRDILVAYTAP